VFGKRVTIMGSSGPKRKSTKVETSEKKGEFLIGARGFVAEGEMTGRCAFGKGEGGGNEKKGIFG